MLKRRYLLRKEITYSIARREEVNILHRLGYHDKQKEFFAKISSKCHWIKTIVAHHLGLPSPDLCHVSDMEDWLYGSFNVCVPVTIQNWKRMMQFGDRVLIRFPLPYRIGEDFMPGNGDEKVRCEAGTYAWAQENCPNVPIPKLYGFGISTGETFTKFDNLPLFHRCIQTLRRLTLSLLNHPLPSSYVRHQPRNLTHEYGVGTGYLLIECVEDKTGQPLSNTWSQNHNDTKLRTNLFRGLSRVLLSVTRVPLPKIGSCTLDNKGYLQLTNRPLSLEIQDLENERISTEIPRDYTYATVDHYITDILRFHDSRILNQPNAINNASDYIYQTAALAAMRTVSNTFFSREFRHGPFVMCPTDFNPSNIFVDKDWNITCLIDLEFACSRPIQMARPPHWLSNKEVHEIVEQPELYNQRRIEFMDALKLEERMLPPALHNKSLWTPLSTIIDKSWERGTFWYTLALASPTDLFAIFYKQIQPRFLKHCPDHSGFADIMSWYWAPEFVQIAANKLEDKKIYDTQLRQEFEPCTPKKL